MTSHFRGLTNFQTHIVRSIKKLGIPHFDVLLKVIYCDSTAVRKSAVITSCGASSENYCSQDLTRSVLKMLCNLQRNNVQHFTIHEKINKRGAVRHACTVTTQLNGSPSVTDRVVALTAIPVPPILSTD
jgi:hypothetical protein